VGWSSIRRRAAGHGLASSPHRSASQHDPAAKEGGEGGEALAEPGLEGGGAEQTAHHEDGDQGWIGRAEDAGEDGIPGDVIGVALLTQCLDDVFAVGDGGVEEAEDVADAAGAAARGRSPIGVGLDGFGWDGAGHGRIKAQSENLGKKLFLHEVGFIRGVAPWHGSRRAKRAAVEHGCLAHWVTGIRRRGRSTFASARAMT